MTIFGNVVRGILKTEPVYRGRPANWRDTDDGSLSPYGICDYNPYAEECLVA